MTRHLVYLLTLCTLVSCRPCEGGGTRSIYDELWRLDRGPGGNGCSVTARVDGRWVNPAAPVWLDEQAEGSGRAAVDNAPRPLFARVDTRLFLERPTYRAFVALLDNYELDETAVEHYTAREREEIDTFLRLVVETAVMRRACRYAERLRGTSFTDEAWKQALHSIWFEVFTNFFKARRSPYCSGFEHVFVGSAGWKATGAKGHLSGCHNWIRFYLCETITSIFDYQGHQYGRWSRQGPSNPSMVTIQLTCTLPHPGGGVQGHLFKKKTGFFVGTSPEFDLAMGTVAFYESLAGVFEGTGRETVIDGSNYVLVLYRNVLPAGGRGNRLHSFFPIYLGPAR